MDLPPSSVVEGDTEPESRPVGAVNACFGCRRSPWGPSLSAFGVTASTLGLPGDETTARLPYERPERNERC